MTAGTVAAGWLRALVVAAVAVGFDQLTKAAVVASFEVGESDSIFYGVELTFVRNEGIAFGAFGGGGPAHPVLVGASMALLIGYFAKHARETVPMAAGGRRSSAGPSAT